MIKKPEMKPEKRRNGTGMEIYTTLGYNQAIEEYDKYHNYVLSKKEEELKVALAHQELELWTRHKKYWLSKLPTEEEIAIICYLTLKPATKEDWKVESKLILNEFRGYGKAIYKRQQRIKGEVI